METVETKDQSTQSDVEPRTNLYGGTATYNLTEDRIHVEFSKRMPREDYEKLRAAGFAWWRGSNQFVQKWNPSAEDFLLEWGIEIEDDDRLDDAEARALRFADRASRNEEKADGARKHVASIADHIPFGQPILVGHHSERHARRDAARIDSGMRKMIELKGKADYWAGRAQAAIAHANYKERPDVIFRRIKKMEAEERSYIRHLSDKAGVECFASQYSDDKYKATRDGGEFTEALQEESARKANARWNSTRRYYKRWLNHIQMVLDYQRELYKQSGGIIAEKTELASKLEVGGGVLVRHDRWCRIIKIHKKTVSVPSGYSWLDKIEFDRIKDVKSKAEFEDIYGPPEVVEKPAIIPKKTITRAEWDRYNAWQHASTHSGVRWIIEKHERIPVIVEGMKWPAGAKPEQKKLADVPPATPPSTQPEASANAS